MTFKGAMNLLEVFFVGPSNTLTRKEGKGEMQSVVDFLQEKYIFLKI